MRWRLPRTGLPLLAKELSEVAARRRTYWVRGTIALGLLAGFCLIYQDALLSRARGWRAAGGEGGGVFNAVVGMQYAMIFLFLPGMLSGVVTEEKERGSFPLLLLTPLGPWSILLSKYASRLVPLATLLCLCLPLYAMAYALGGVEGSDLVRAAGLLALAALELGAVGLFASTVSSSSLAAFLLAYALTALLSLGPALFCALLRELELLARQDVRELERQLLPLFVPYLHFGRPGTGIGQTLARSLPVIGLVALLLLLARFCLVRLASARRRPLVPRLLAAADRWVRAANDRLAGGVVLVAEASRLPVHEPVAWREVTKKPLGQLRNFLRVTLLLAVPVFVVASLAIAGQEPRQAGGTLSAMVFCLWSVALLVLAAQGAGAFSTERMHQTLELLLTTPLAAREIVAQKARGLRRTMLALAVPLVLLHLLQAWRLAERPGLGAPGQYLVGSVLCLAIYLPLAGWFSLAVGMRLRTRFRAVVGAVGGLVAWIVAPLIVLSFVRMGAGDPWSSPVFLLCPATLPGLLELDAGRGVWSHIAANTFWYGMWLAIFQAWTLGGAERSLGRA